MRTSLIARLVFALAALAGESVARAEDVIIEQVAEVAKASAEPQGDATVATKKRRGAKPKIKAKGPEVLRPVPLHGLRVRR